MENELEKQYIHQSGIQITSVRMVNINYGRSKNILSACKPLNEYAWLVEQIRSNINAGMEIEKAADRKAGRRKSSCNSYK